MPPPTCSGGWRPRPTRRPPVSTLRTIRGGGADFDAKCLVAALEAVGCTAVRVVPRQGPAPMEQRAQLVPGSPVGLDADIVGH